MGIIQIVDAVDQLDLTSELTSLRTWRDLPTAVRLLEGLPTPDGGLPPVLTFADRLARLGSGPEADELRQWIDTVAGGLGVDNTALAELRAARGTSGSHRHQLSGSSGVSERTRRSDNAGLIWGGVPIRNRNFTGRTVLLERLAEALRTSSRASVLPQALQGMSGVGKTQLVVEYVYRNLDHYDLVWWIPAGQTATVLVSLTQLAERLGLATTEDLQQTARTALDALASSDLNWLLVYDNADDPAALDQFVPSTGGHVILTTRNQEFSRVGQAIEVDVFERLESVELLQRRSRDDRGNAQISTTEADELAEKLGDLPLALEQAAAWHLATAMPVNEYIELLDRHLVDVLSEGKPANYPLTVAAYVRLTLKILRETAPASARLFELFAFLGDEPIAIPLLRRGRDADVSEPLRTLLAEAIPMARTVRDLGRFGLARFDAAQRVQVHRLVRWVLRESLSPQRAGETLHNVQCLLSAANPGDPDSDQEHELYRQLGPHLGSADMINAVRVEARQVVLDHVRFLYVTGDYENSRALAEQAAQVWSREVSDPKLGPDGLFTLTARSQVANAARVLGDRATAVTTVLDTYDRMRAALGPDHDLTLITGNQIGEDLRLAGRYQEATEFDRESVALHLLTFGPGDVCTLRAQTNLAVDRRMVGDFTAALRLDREITDHWGSAGGFHSRAMAAHINLARDYYGLGAYQTALDILERWRGPMAEVQGPNHSQVLLAGRTYGITLRKAGRLTEAADVIRENEERVRIRFGPDHEFSLAAVMSYANVLRELGDLDHSLALMTEARRRYDDRFGVAHPLALAACVNEAILRRARSEYAASRALNEQAYAQLLNTLGEGHPYTLCAGASLATDYAACGNSEMARRLSEGIVQRGRAGADGGHEARHGAEHPDALMRSINFSHDLRSVGEVTQADVLLEGSIAGLRRSLGPDHPEVHAVERGARIDGDIEPPPT